MVDMKSGVPFVRALDRGLSLLQAFTPDVPQLPLTHLAKKTGLDTGTTRRLLQTLMIAGFVGHDEVTSNYYLTRKVLELGASVRTDHDLKGIGFAYLRDLAEKTGATAFLWLYVDGMALCIDRVRSTIPNVEAAWFSIGAMTTLNCGAGPKVLLAHIDARERAYALTKPLTLRTPTSIADPAVLSEQADQIREQGWDLAVDDFVLGLAGLGVPIFTSAGELAGSLSISTLTSAFGNRKQPNFLTELKAAATAIGARL